MSKRREPPSGLIAEATKLFEEAGYYYNPSVEGFVRRAANPFFEHDSVSWEKLEDYGLVHDKPSAFTASSGLAWLREHIKVAANKIGVSATLS
jgi:hypothetical protein